MHGVKKKSSGRTECWYVEILQHMHAFCSQDALKKKQKKRWGAVLN